jgi:hypothetical protein
MKRQFENTKSELNWLLSQLTAEKKKTVVALSLIAVMALMWVRVLGRRTAEGAEAAMQQKNIDVPASVMGSDTGRSFIELPVVEGRNDMLTRDFFASNGWRDFARGGEGRNSGAKEVNVVSKNGNEEVVKRIVARIRLQAILSAGNSQVFINDRLLSVGDKLPIREGNDVFDCEVIEIKENEVSIRFEEARITLRLARAGEAPD